MIFILGIIGLSLLLLGWIYETLQTIKDRHCDVKLTFAGLYFIGSLLLSIYAFVLDDVIFMALNGTAAIIALINIYFILFGEKYSAEYKKLLKKRN
ncbi:hypothetical protein KO317_02270 [Candidatus Micrarchaeota archaeon]|nr:hypothetical protein [Candidatus Micrarchaeota archaeon]